MTKRPVLYPHNFDFGEALRRYAAGALPKSQSRFGATLTGKLMHLYIGDPLGRGEWHLVCRHHKSITNAVLAKWDGRPHLERLKVCGWCERKVQITRNHPLQVRYRGTAVDALRQIAKMSTADEVERIGEEGAVLFPEGVVLARVHAFALAAILAGAE